MASIATCPGCTAQLAVPDAATADCRVLCPECAAEFSICETIQLALPKAMILPPQEETPVIESSSNEEVDAPVETPPSSAPLASWEARLKNAISADAEPESQPANYETYEPTAKVEAEPQQVGYETFEPTHEPAPTFDFASQPETSSNEEPTNILENKVLEDKVEVAKPASAAPAPMVATEFAATEEVDVPQIQVGENSAERPRRRWRRVAALVLAGPVMGTVLGFYGLLWIKGPQADYLQLSRILPGMMLPATDVEEKISEDLLAQPLLSQEGSDQKTTQLVATRRDTQVQPATAQQQIPLAGISAQEFGRLVDDASRALPGFLQTNSTAENAFHMKAQAYMVVCRLAEQFAFSHQLGLSPQAQQEIERGKMLFQQTTADASVLEDLTYIASRWWEYNERSNQGIFFVGQIGNIQRVGSQTLCHIMLPGNSGLEIPVLFDQLQFRGGQQIAVVGRVVNKPKQHGVDYPRVVIPQFSYALAELRAP